MMNNYKLKLFVTNVNFNVTNNDNPITYYLKSYDYYFSKILKKHINFYFEKNKITTYANYIPPSMFNLSAQDYFLNNNHRDINLIVNDLKESDKYFFEVKLFSSLTQNIFTRTYPNILDILFRKFYF